MNSTWIISPNWSAWGLLFLAVAALCVIAFYIRRISNGPADNIPRQLERVHHVNTGNYKIVILTIWLVFSGWLMYKIYSNPINVLDKSNVWSNLIAIIGIIVATLIGWQIYSAMDWNSKIERISNIERTYAKLFADVGNNRKFVEATILLFNARAQLNSIEDIEKAKDDFADLYKQLLEAISLFVAPSVERQIQDCIDWMLGAMDNMERFKTGDGAQISNVSVTNYMN